MINTETLLFATHPSKSNKEMPNSDQLRHMDELERLAAPFRSHPTMWPRQD